MRIRSIKPEFWRSDDITSLPLEDRLLFIGLWSYVDDNGVGRDELDLLLADLFPRDWFRNPRETLARVSRGLARLSEGGLIDRYTVSGKPFLRVTAWERHQRVDKPNKPRYPGPDQRDSADRETLATSSRDSRENLAPGAVDQGAGEQGNREHVFDRSLALIDQDEVSEPDPQPAIDEAFEQWWTHVRRKVSKPHAETAFAKALNKIGGRRSDALEILTSAIDEHQRHWFELEGRAISKTPHMATWLNGESWSDELPADSEYTARANAPTTESPTERIMRMRNAAYAQMNGGDTNGNDRRMPRSIDSARVS